MQPYKMINGVRLLLSFLMVFSIVILLPNPGHANEQSETVTSTGVSLASSEFSRRQAIEDALRNAVEQAMGTYVTVDLIVKNKKLVDERILSQSKGYIKKYKVVDEEKTGNLYKVRITATVMLGKVRDDLAATGLLMQRKQMPRFMVFTTTNETDEIYLRDKQYVGSIRNIIEQGFLKRKFRLVESRSNKQGSSSAPTVADDSRLVSLAKGAEAEILVSARATRYFERETALYGSKYKFYRSEVQLRVIETGTGNIIYSGTKQGETSATLDPLYDSTRHLTNKAIEAVLQKWSTDVNTATNLKLVINKINFPKLAILEKNIRNIGRVSALHRRKFSGNQALYDIDFRGSSDELAKQLLSITAIKLTITGISQQTVDAEIHP